MKRLAAIGILCAAAGAALAEGPLATRPAFNPSSEATQTHIGPGVFSLVPPPETPAQMEKRHLKDAINSRDQAQAALSGAVIQLDTARSVRESLRRDLLKITGRTDSRGVVDAIRELEDMREKALLARTMKKNREMLLQVKIASIADAVQKGGADDKITRELEAIVAAREQAAKNMEAIAAQRDVVAAQAAAGEARIQLLERREALATAAYGDTLSMLNKELVEVSLDADEQAKLVEALDARLKVLREGQPDCDGILEYDARIARMEPEVDRLRSNYNALQDQVNQLQKETDKP